MIQHALGQTPAHIAALALATLTSLSGQAQASAPGDELDALALADQTEVETIEQRDWRFFIEGMIGHTNQKEPLDDIHPARISIDLNIDQRINENWRAIFADRLDISWLLESNGQARHDAHINTLKEAYLSWQAQPSLVFDMGRINQRNGMALGYNPSDYFKVGALRSVVSIAPASLRENRLGSGMLRGQYIWDGGSVSALYSPKLGDHRETAPFALDFGTSNPAHRWQLALSQAWFEGFSPQFLLYGEAGRDIQLGANASWLVNDALSAHFEYSGGRGPSLAAQALGQTGDEGFYSRLATGATYTFALNLSLTLEYHYNQAALKKADWQRLGQNQPAYWAYRQQVFQLQDTPTQHNLFALANWNQAGWRNLDLSLMLRHDLLDQSLQSYLEARYHFKQADLALQWQSQHGTAGSQFGALPQKNSVQALLKYFF